MLPVLLFFLFALLGATSPIDDMNPPPSGLSWTGNIAGHGLVTLNGDASSVQDQIFALNPSLKENFVPSSKLISDVSRTYNASEMYAAPDSTASYYYTKPVAVRDDVNGAKKLSDGFRPIDWCCGTFATGDVAELHDATNKVASPGGQDPSRAMWSIAGGINGRANCQRLACAQNGIKPGSTAIYLCNDNEFAVTKAADNLAAVAASIASGHQNFNFAGCCRKSQAISSRKQFSGQMHLGNGTNFNVGYGDCSKPDYFVNPGSLTAPGPLGICI